MGVSWSRTSVRRVQATGAQIRDLAIQIKEQAGPQAVEHIQRNIWNYGRFVYRNVRPKPSFSRSERAWRFTVTRDKDGAILTVYNDATDRRGVAYPRFVHLAGRPRSDLLMGEVNTYMATVLGKEDGIAFSAGYGDLAVALGTKTTSVTWGG